MLDYPVLRKKPNIVIYRNGERNEMQDLLSRTYIDNEDAYGKYVVVSKEYIARPDLISLAIYGTDNYADMICKANGISNPFELNEDMILFIPSQEFLNESIAIVGTKSELVSPKSKINSNGTNDNIFSEFSTSALTNERMKTSLNKDLLFGGKGVPNMRSNSISGASIGKDVSNGKKMKNERRSPAEQTIDDENYVIRKDLGLVFY